jgi:hypothetical protein
VAAAFEGQAHGVGMRHVAVEIDAGRHLPTTAVISPLDPLKGESSQTLAPPRIGGALLAEAGPDGESHCRRLIHIPIWGLY